jgi:hypothetical protein
MGILLKSERIRSKRFRLIPSSRCGSWNAYDQLAVGGSIAGLAILGQYVYSAAYTQGTTPDLNSDGILANYYNSSFYKDGTTAISDGVLDLDTLRGIVTETHFQTRGRLGRLLSFMGSTLLPSADGGYDQSTVGGLAVDQGTALVVSSAGWATVFGGYVYIAVASSCGVGLSPVCGTGGAQATLTLPSVNLVWFGAGTLPFNFATAYDYAEDPASSLVSSQYATFSVSGGTITQTAGDTLPEPDIVSGGS